jgi:hypothetical protein
MCGGVAPKINVDVGIMSGSGVLGVRLIVMNENTIEISPVAAVITIPMISIWS